MNNLPLCVPRRSAIFSSLALLLALFQIAATLICFAWVGLDLQQRPPGDVQWGEGMGFIVLLAYLIIAHVALVTVGFLLTLLSFWRREQPEWRRETALAIYGTAALAVAALAIIYAAWRFFPR